MRKKKRLLWLDDIRDPMNDNWLSYSPIGKNVDVYWVKSYQEFVDWITNNGLPDGICFDHDLGEDKTGYDAAKWLVDYCIDQQLMIPRWNIQSSNPVGSINIDSILFNYMRFSSDKI